MAGSRLSYDSSKDATTDGDESRAIMGRGVVEEWSGGVEGGGQKRLSANQSTGLKCFKLPQTGVKWV
jgi:hypothetical protein